MTMMSSTAIQPQNLLDIESIRAVHQEAKQNLAAKQTELRLVVASRYKELVHLYPGNNNNASNQKDGPELQHQGTYGELCVMHADATKLVEVLEEDDAQESMEQLMKDTILYSSVNGGSDYSKRKRYDKSSYIREDTKVDMEASSLELLSLSGFKSELSGMPRRVHQFIGNSKSSSPMQAAQSLVRAFCLIDCQNYTCAEEYTSKHSSNDSVAYPVARQYSSQFYPNTSIEVQLDNQNGKDRNFDYQVRMIYQHLLHLPKRVVTMAKDILVRENMEAQDCAGALVALVLMDKGLTLNTAELSGRLLDVYLEHKAKMLVKLLKYGNDKNFNDSEEYLTSLVEMVQNFILQTHIIFDPKGTDCSSNIAILLSQYSAVNFSMSMNLLRDKVSRFLSSYLPLVRKTSQSVLSEMKNDAAYIGNIREILYKLVTRVDSNNEWRFACDSVIDKTLLSNTTSQKDKNLSLWETLFRSTFDHLVHNLLEHSYTSLDTKITNIIENVCSSAPSYKEIKAHDICVNVAKIVNYLQALLANLVNESQSLIHSECAEESSISLKESLYIQTCALMASFICKLRKRLRTSDQDKEYLASLNLIIGRLCNLLIMQLEDSKHRKNPFSILLDSDSVSTLAASTTLDDLKGSFEICNVDDSGFLNADTVLECLQSTFTARNEGLRQDIMSAISTECLDSITFEELSLFSARGISHNSKHSPFDARSIMVSGLTELFTHCMEEWANTVVRAHANDLETDLLTKYPHSLEKNNDGVFVPKSISSSVTGYFLRIAGDLIGSICPSDVQAQSLKCSLYIINSMQSTLIRKSCATVSNILTSQSFSSLLEREPSGETEVALVQLWFDIKYIIFAYQQSNCSDGIDMNQDHLLTIEKVHEDIESRIDPVSLELMMSSIAGSRSLKDVLLSYILPFKLLTDSLFQMQSASSLSSENEMTVESSVLPSLVPISSTRRFALLPIETERQNLLLQLQRQANAANKDVNGVKSSNKADSSSNPLSSTSFGFLSSMLRK